MDRCRRIVALTFVLSFTGCAASQSLLFDFQGKLTSHADMLDSPAIGVVPETTAGETCQPFIINDSESDSSALVTTRATDCQCPKCLNSRGAPVCGEQICGDGRAGVEGCGRSAGRGSRMGGRYSGLDGGFERGRKNLLLDGTGWVMGIPSKLLLWNSKVDSHSVSPEVEDELRRYLTNRGLDDVKVRINQYDPVGEWTRLLQNKSIHPAFKFTVGAFAVSKYSLVPGRVFGADEYNPFTNTISLYSDRASLALREGAHARSAIEARHRGLFASSMYLPMSPAWVDTISTREVVAYTKEIGNRKLERESYLVLFPAFGARLGSSMTMFVDPGAGQAAQAGLAMVGHAVGRTMAFRVSDTPVDMVKSVYGIVRRRQQQDVPVAEQDDQDEEIPVAEQSDELQPPQNIFPVHFVPVELSYDSVSRS